MTLKRYVADWYQFPVMWPIFIFCKDIFCKRSFDAETPQYKRRHHSSAFFLFSTNSVTITTTTTKPTARQHKHISLICNSKLPLPGTQTDVHTMSTLDNTQTNKRDAEKPSPTKKQMKPPKYSNPSPASAPTSPQEHHTTPTFGPSHQSNQCHILCICSPTHPDTHLCRIDGQRNTREYRRGENTVEYGDY